MAVERSQADIDWLHTLRREEFAAIMPFLPVSQSKRVLEIGSGTGYLLSLLGKHFESVQGLEVSSSAYASNDPRIAVYDGKVLPFDDNTFDVIFSCHVIEHVEDFDLFCKETRRVLKSDGVIIHIAPSSTWRLFTSLFHYLHLISLPFLVYVIGDRSIGSRSASNFPKFKDKLLYIIMAPRHGLKGNRITEFYYFSRRYWIKRFKGNHFKNVDSCSTRILYWGHDVIRSKLPINIRRRMSCIFGSSSNIFIIRLHK